MSDANRSFKVSPLQNIAPVFVMAYPRHGCSLRVVTFRLLRHLAVALVRAWSGRHKLRATPQSWQAGQLPKPAPAKAGVAVSPSLANHDASLPIAYRLYLPEDWATDQARRDKARVPETIAFQTKPEIAFEQIKAARAAGLPEGVVLMDAGYGNDTGLRTDITALGLRYVAGIGPNTSVWPPGEAPMAPQSQTS